MRPPPPTELFEQIVGSAVAHAIFVVNVDGTIATWNRGAVRIFGFTADQVIGQHFEILFTPEERQIGIPQHELAEAVARGVGEDNRWHLRKDGTRFFSRGVTVPLLDGETVIAFAKIAADATEQKLAETQLAAQTATLRILAEHVDIESAAADLLSAVCQNLDWEIGQLWSVNEQSLLVCVDTWTSGTVDLPLMPALCGAHPLERGEGLPGLVFESGRPGWHEDVQTRPGLPRADIFKQIGIHGALVFPITIGSTVVGVLELFSRHVRPEDPYVLETLAGVGAHIGLFIGRKRAEDALRNSEERYRVVSETASDAIVTMSEDGLIVYANPAVRKIFGHEPADLIGKPMEVLIPERLREAHRRGVQRYLSTRKANIPWSGVELPGLHKEGHELPLEISFGEQRAEGDHHLFTGYMRDIRQRKSVEEENKRLFDEAQEANRAKDEFLATVSHELRTPMTAVIGWTRVLKMGADEETLREAIDAIERSASAQAQLIDDILDVSRITMGKLRFRAEPVSLQEVVAAATDTMRVAAEARNVKIETEIADIPLVMGDPSRLQQVFWNLISNAIKFTPPEGKVTVILEPHGENARLVVKDSGEGISDEFLPHIFERFRQAEGSSKRSHGGLGLGLAIVKHLVELHGGTVSAASDGIGRGATFTLELPFAKDVKEVGDSTTTHRLRRRGADTLERLEGIDIVLVEDDQSTREFLVKLMDRSGANVRDFSNVTDAIAAINSERPQVVVSDLAMPERDGYDLIRAIRESEKEGDHLPVIAITASGAAGDRDRALDAGFDRYLRKPIEPGALLESIREVVDEQ